MHPLESRSALLLFALWLPFATGCTASAGHTLVEGRLRPGHFKFSTVVEKTTPGPDGWRVACIHLRISRTTGESYHCIFGVELPLETTGKGAISVESAQRTAARSANLAASIAFAPTTAATPLGMACTSFIQTYLSTLSRALAGSRVTRLCHPSAEPSIAP